MARKFMAILVVVGIIGVSLWGCSKSSETTKKVDDNLEQEIVENGEGEEIDEMSKLLDAAKEEPVCGLWTKLPYREGSLEDYNNALKEYGKGNAYAEEINRLYVDLDIDNQSDFARDYLDFYCHSKFQNENKIDYDKITKIWKVGYDENDMVINGTDKKTYRKIVAQIGNNTEEYYTYSTFRFIFKGEYRGVLRATSIYSGPNIGFGDDENEGIWKPEIEDEEIIGAPYKLVEETEIESILSNNQELLTLLDECYSKVAVPYVYKASSKEETAKEPYIGMSRGDVEISTWGKPDKINKDEYEWGTQEQWVYDGKGYIYLENGIVTAIQHR